MVLYRSRRDMMELVTNLRFAPALSFKAAAMANTLAFPVPPGRVVFGARVVAALALTLLAPLAHLALLIMSTAG